MAKRLQNIAVEAKLKALGRMVFTPRDFQGIFGVSPKVASMFILNNVKSGLFIKLRNNFYSVKDSNSDYPFIANILYQPSYVSLETALSHYKIIPEVVYSTTSITTKAPREFKTPIGNFAYRHIKTAAFTGYTLQEIDRHKALFAEPEKALADYLYFVDIKKLSLNDRIKLKGLDKKKLIAYARLFRRPGMLDLINQMYVDARKPRTIY